MPKTINSGELGPLGWSIAVNVVLLGIFAVQHSFMPKSAGAAAVITGIAWLGWATVLVSTFLVSHFHLFGLSQGFARVLGLSQVEPRFVTPSLYRIMRHSIYAGFIVAFWATPEMTLGHLLFAVATTGYILIGIQLEERDLIGQFGDRYRQYRVSVGMLGPRWPRRLPLPRRLSLSRRSRNGRAAG